MHHDILVRQHAFFINLANQSFKDKAREGGQVTRMRGYGIS